MFELLYTYKIVVHIKKTRSSNGAATPRNESPIHKTQQENICLCVLTKHQYRTDTYTYYNVKSIHMSMWLSSQFSNFIMVFLWKLNIDWAIPRFWRGLFMFGSIPILPFSLCENCTEFLLKTTQFLICTNKIARLLWMVFLFPIF